MRSLGRALHAGLALILAGNLVVILTWPLQTGDSPRQALDPLYSAFCHRIPERCYQLGGEPLPVCARCLGIWMGLLCAAGLAAAGQLHMNRRTLIRAMLLLTMMAGSWLLGVLVLPAHWHLERTLAGWLGGMGLYVLLWALLRMATRLVFRVIVSRQPPLRETITRAVRLAKFTRPSQDRSCLRRADS